MGISGSILLTGATGLLGRYLLRDLLASGRRVAVLARDAPPVRAEERVRELVAFWSEALGTRLARPVVLAGDLGAPGLGLGTAGRRWLAAHCRAVLHAAANVSYHETAEGEPWETNVNGTRRLLALCRSAGIESVHHVSTAFVCGSRRGLVREDELDCGTGPNNAYEGSKFAAEQAVRQAPAIRATVYRPSVVVGDSQTGYTTTYHHFYRFLELAVRLSKPTAGPGTRRRLPVRLPLTGEETQNLVPVDWVSQALVRLVHAPRWHGHTFHLAAWGPVRLREIKAIVDELLHLEGVEWAGPDGPEDPTSLEQLVLEQYRDYWAYLHSSLVFDCRNTRRALPDLPPPPFDRDLAARLLDFAQADQWGRGPTRARPAFYSASPGCAHYLERFLPEQLRRSALVQAVSLDVVFAFDLSGPGGGQWSCRWRSGGHVEVRRGLAGDAACTYRTDAGTFEAIIRGRQTPQDAFFRGAVDIIGDLEKALKLATLFERFLAEAPYPAPETREVPHAAVHT